MGNMFPIPVTQDGASSSGMKTPETNSRGRAVALEIAGAASPLGITAAKAIPRAAKQAIPTSRVNSMAGNIRQITSRSEEHTSELQSRAKLICRMLLEKKKL